MANSHTAAFKAQSDFAPEAKLKIGNDIWWAETAGSRLFEQVLSKNPGTVQKVIDKAAELDPPFTSKQVQGHLRWLYTAGQLEVDGVSYVVQAKPTKEPKPAKEPAKEAKGKFKPKVKATTARKRSFVKTKAMKRAA